MFRRLPGDDAQDSPIPPACHEAQDENQRLPVETDRPLSRTRIDRLIEPVTLVAPAWDQSSATLAPFDELRDISGVLTAHAELHAPTKDGGCLDTAPSLRDEHEVGLELRDLVPLQAVAVATRLLREITKDLLDAWGDAVIDTVIVHGTSLASRTDSLLTAAMRALTADAHQLAPAR